MLIYVILVILAITAISTNINVQAVETGTIGFKLNVTASKTTVKPVNKITITLAVSDISLGENGMNTLEEVINYSRETFEEAKSSDITTQNNWTITYDDEDTELNGKFLATRMAGGI